MNRRRVLNTSCAALFVFVFATAAAAQSAGSMADTLRVAAQKRDMAAIAAITSQGAAAVPGLIEALKDPEWMVRATAAKVLGDIGDPAAPAARALIAALKDPNSAVSNTAKETLTKLGAAIVPNLIAMLRDNDVSVRLAAAPIIVGLGPRAAAAAPALVAALNSPETSELAAQALLSIGAPLDAAPALLSFLEKTPDTSPSVMAVSYAAQALGRIGAPVVPQLMSALRGAHGRQATEYVYVVNRLLQAVGEAGPAAAAAVPLLIEMLEKRADTRYAPTHAVATALGKLGPAARPAIPILREVYSETRNDKLQFVASDAAVALIRLGSVPDNVIPLFVAVIEKADPWQADMDVVEALGMLGQQASPALPALRAAARKSLFPSNRAAIEKVITKIELSR